MQIRRISKEGKERLYEESHSLVKCDQLEAEQASRWRRRVPPFLRQPPLKSLISFSYVEESSTVLAE